MVARRRLEGHPTGAQLRAARGLLNLSVLQLSEMSGLAINTIKRAEAVNGLAPTTSANAKLMVTLLSGAGVRFLPAEGGLGAGVRMLADDQPVQPRRRNTPKSKITSKAKQKEPTETLLRAPTKPVALREAVPERDG